LRLVGRVDAAPTWRERCVLAVWVAQKPRRRSSDSIDRTITGTARNAIFSAESECQALIHQFEQIAVSIRVALEFLNPRKELRTGINIAAQHDDKRLARPRTSTTPRRVKRQIIKERGDGPGGCISPGKGGPGCYDGVTCLYQFVEQPGPQSLGVLGRKRVFEFGRELQQRRECID
jgi:hypothetical protein